MSRPTAIVGWDIGGVNTKAARISGPGFSDHGSLCLPFELQRDPSRLEATLRSAAQQLGSAAADRHAVTMTGELSQAFRTKAEGVGFILDALEAAFAPDRLHVYTVVGGFVSPQEARRRPLDIAASNWVATANWTARLIPTCILIDTGTTTTDLIPIVGGKIVAEGRNDPERLLCGELVYTGVLRTPVEVVSRRVPLWGGSAGLSAEGFALMGDAYLWLGRLETGDYTCPTPDGRPSTRDFAGERLARVVCADRDLLEDAAIDGIAAALAGAQLQTIVEALEAIRRRQPTIDTAVVTGLGGFLAAEAARTAGLTAIRLQDKLDGAAQTAPAIAVACLLRDSLELER
jgi:(4-(4-[2-(gamma-L-glutamylamino)ethyl]phenoxymethyl)furan-2-yl)methanamine synthase